MGHGPNLTLNISYYEQTANKEHINYNIPEFLNIIILHVHVCGEQTDSIFFNQHNVNVEHCNNYRSSTLLFTNTTSRKPGSPFEFSINPKIKTARQVIL